MKDVPKAIEAVWKIESTRLIAASARVTHDIGIAEELAQDALVTALELWPEEGIPAYTVLGWRVADISAAVKELKNSI
jgi:predicted RNA polymerase sigma factor